MIASRLDSRRDHFVGRTLLDSQLATLEPLENDEDGMVLDVAAPLDSLVEEVLRNMGRRIPFLSPPIRFLILCDPETETHTWEVSAMLKSFTKLALASAIGVALGASAMAQEMTLKFQSSDPAGNPNFVLQQGWAESIKEKTGGKLAIELLPVEIDRCPQRNPGRHRWRHS